MGIDVTLRRGDGQPLKGLPDPTGGTFDAAGDFDDLLESSTLPVLGSFDPYGQITLDSQSMEALIVDVDTALNQPGTGSQARGLRRLRVMAEMCRADESLTLHVMGDYARASAQGSNRGGFLQRTWLRNRGRSGWPQRSR